MVGLLYLLLALSCWTVWAVLSARLGGRFSPLNSLLWTGLVSAIITIGGFVVHFRQVRVPSSADWWLMCLFCVANTLACFGYYAALRHLPGTLVLPISHLYLVIGPVLLALMERRALSWQQFLALSIMMGGMALFLVVSPGSSSDPATAAAPSMAREAKRIRNSEAPVKRVSRGTGLSLHKPQSQADVLRSRPLRASRNASTAQARMTGRETSLFELLQMDEYR